MLDFKYENRKKIDNVVPWRNISELYEIWLRKSEVENYKYEDDVVEINLEEPDNQWYYIVTDAGEQVLIGNFSEKVTITGVASQVIVGEIPIVGTVADARDVIADFANWEWTLSHAGTTLLDIVGLVPIIGALKYVDEASIVVKGAKLSDEAGEVLTSAAKHADGISDAGKRSDDLGSAVNDAFTKHVDEAGTVTKASSKVLRENMIKAGQVVPDYPNAAHHIVAGTHPKAEGARKILQDFGIDINDASNGVFLPTKKDVANSAYHPSLHTSEYFEEVEDLLSHANSREDALEILEDIRTQLLNGTFLERN